jgi:hypothetical protein
MSHNVVAAPGANAFGGLDPAIGNPPHHLGERGWRALQNLGGFGKLELHTEFSLIGRNRAANRDYLPMPSDRLHSVPGLGPKRYTQDSRRKFRKELKAGATSETHAGTGFALSLGAGGMAVP